VTAETEVPCRPYVGDCMPERHHFFPQANVGSVKRCLLVRQAKDVRCAALSLLFLFRFRLFPPEQTLARHYESHVSQILAIDVFTPRSFVIDKRNYSWQTAISWHDASEEPKSDFVKNTDSQIIQSLADAGNVTLKQ
jgi:hypothetical protein